MASLTQAVDILIADDDTDHCFAMKKILEHAGYAVEVAHDGEIALRLLEELRPRLVIFDSLLPRKTGIECLREIQARLEMKSLRVAMCSARTNLDYVLECAEAGAEAFIHKPVEADTLLERIRKILAGS